MQFSQADASKQNKNVEIETRSFLRTQLFCFRPILFRSESQKRHLQKKFINWYIVILCVKRKQLLVLTRQCYHRLQADAWPRIYFEIFLDSYPFPKRAFFHQT